MHSPDQRPLQLPLYHKLDICSERRHVGWWGDSDPPPSHVHSLITCRAGCDGIYTLCSLDSASTPSRVQGGHGLPGGDDSDGPASIEHSGPALSSALSQPRTGRLWAPSLCRAGEPRAVRLTCPLSHSRS